jgi:hypothetical protein
MVAELKKQRYVYYHCTGHRGKCPEPYTRKETLITEFASTLSQLVVPQEILAWLTDEVNASDFTQAVAREKTVKRHEAEVRCLRDRLNTLYEDRLDGTITKAFYEAKSATIQAQITDLQTKIISNRDTDLPPLTTALDIAQQTSNACKEATWKDAQLRTTLLEPFELLRRSNQASTNGINGNDGSTPDFGIGSPRRGFRTTILTGF